MSHRLVYMTAETREDAERIGRALVGERIAACVNILDGMRSMYWWEGEVQQSGEVVLIAKTRAALVDKLTERVRELHDYDCPCVVSLVIDGGNPEFLAWIDAETT